MTHYFHNDNEISNIFYLNRLKDFSGFEEN